MKASFFKGVCCIGLQWRGGGVGERETKRLRDDAGSRENNLLSNSSHKTACSFLPIYNGFAISELKDNLVRKAFQS